MLPCMSKEKGLTREVMVRRYTTYKYSKIEQKIITTPLSKPLANMILHMEQFYPWFAAIAVCNSRKFFFDNKNARLYLYCTHAHEPQDHARAHTHTDSVCRLTPANRYNFEKIDFFVSVVNYYCCGENNSHSCSLSLSFYLTIYLSIYLSIFLSITLNTPTYLHTYLYT